jgi:hypothetical protein
MMRCYVIATGLVFALIFVAHAARVFAEGTWVLHQPVFIVTTLLSLGVAVWAAWLVFRRPR